MLTFNNVEKDSNKNLNLNNIIKFNLKDIMNIAPRQNNIEIESDEGETIKNNVLPNCSTIMSDS